MSVLGAESGFPPPPPSLPEVVIARNEALPANPCPSAAGGLLALEERTQKLIEIRGISVFLLSSSWPRSHGASPHPGC